jgi:choline dehydrogenase-like flavoprotein
MQKLYGAADGAPGGFPGGNEDGPSVEETDNITWATGQVFFSSLLDTIGLSRRASTSTTIMPPNNDERTARDDASRAQVYIIIIHLFFVF